MEQGTIKQMNSDQGFGFIFPRAGKLPKKDLLFIRADVHGSDYEDLCVGQQVTYDLSTDERDETTKAINVAALPRR